MPGPAQSPPRTGFGYSLKHGSHGCAAAATMSQKWTDIVTVPDWLVINQLAKINFVKYTAVHISNLRCSSLNHVLRPPSTYIKCGMK